MWLRRWRQKRLEEKSFNEQQTLLKELEEAKEDWINAYKKLDHVLEKEQIDYAIFSLEAAEKRYEMLLRKFKEQYPDHINMDEEKNVKQNVQQINEENQKEVGAEDSDVAYVEAVASKEGTE